MNVRRKRPETKFAVNNTGVMAASESGPDLLTSFIFDHELKSSIPYQRLRLQEMDLNADSDAQNSLLTVEDVSDILSLSLPLNKSETSAIIELPVTEGKLS